MADEVTPPAAAPAAPEGASPATAEKRVRRKRVVRVICAANPRHKQRQG